MFLKCRARVCKNRKGIAPLVLIILLVALAAAAYIVFSQLQPHPRSPVRIQDFGIQPSKFKIDEKGQLSVKIENLLSNDSVRVTIYFETHENVKIYQGSTPLSSVCGNYTLTKQLDPSEISELRFAVKGTIDVGDNSRDYYIKGYFYVDNVCYDVQTVSFTIQRN
jgi:hypothetical protein